MRSGIKNLIFVVLLVFSLAPNIALSQMVVDDFEAYSDGTVIGQSPSSRPWRRFGLATNDHIYATGQPHRVINGSRSAIYGLTWPAGFGGIRKALDTSTDISQFKFASVKIRSERSSTHTTVSLSISNGPTTYATAKTYPLTGEIQELNFEIDRDALVRAAGSDSYDDVITGTTSIGLDFRNAEGSYYETVVFDDLILSKDLVTDPDDAQLSTIK